MYYTLNENYVLRGWNNAPYVLCNIVNAENRFLSEAEFKALLICNGFIHSNNILITSVCKNIIESFIKENIVSSSQYESSIADNQRYKVYPSKYIKSAHWSITGKCNYKCRHCLISAPHSKRGEMTLQDCYKIIDDLHKCGIMYISITGGEPLIRSDFFDIVDKILEKNIIITSIYSNGRLITPELLNKLEKRGVKPEISISFDGVGWHDWLRGVKHAETDALNAFKLCSEYGLITTAEMCIHKLNVHSVRETVNLLANLNVKSLKIGSIIPSGEWTDGNLDYSLTYEETLDAFLEYIKFFYEDKMPMNITLGGVFKGKKGSKKYTIPLVKDYKDINNVYEQYICGHASTNIYIGADGKILPCMPLANSVINDKFADILQLNLSDILNDSFYSEIINIKVGDFLKKNDTCSRCEHKLICQGGCRGLAIEENNDDYFLIDKEACFFFKNGYMQKVINVISQYT